MWFDNRIFIIKLEWGYYGRFNLIWLVFLKKEKNLGVKKCGEGRYEDVGKGSYLE